MPLSKLRILERKASSHSSLPMAIWTSAACTLLARKQIACASIISERSQVSISGVKENLCPLLVTFHPGLLPHPNPPPPSSQFPPAGFPLQLPVTLTGTLNYQEITLIQPWKHVVIHVASGWMCITWTGATEQVKWNSNSWDLEKNVICSITLLMRFSWKFIFGVTWTSWNWKMLT